MDKIKVNSKGKKVENEKSEKYKKTAAEMKKKAAEDKKKAEKAREKAKAASAANAAASSGGSGSTFASLGTAVAAGIASNAVSGAKKKGKGILTIIIIIVLAVVALIVINKLTGGLNDAKEPIETFAEGLTTTTLDFQSAILGESREKQMYVVFEQDVQVDSELSQALLGLDIFNRTKTVHSYGTGHYAVDMSKLTESSIAVDDAEKTVTVTIPHTVLYVVDYDVNKTEFEDTEKGLLAFGDMKMTLEQQNELERSIDKAMNDTLSEPELFAQADEIALLQVRELFQPLVTAVSEEYLVVIVMDGEAGPEIAATELN